MDKGGYKSQKEEAIARGMHVGRDIEYMQHVKQDGRTVEKKRRGVVNGMFPYVFRCKMQNGIQECFRYNLLLGNENGSRVVLKGAKLSK